MTRRPIARACMACVALLVCGAFAQQPQTQGPRPPASTASTPATQGNAVFSNAELDQMFAPIALYPDALLAQILMASTYPGDVADAAAWSKANPNAKGDAAVKQVANQPWDPSVQSLVAVPQVLASLSQDAAWVQKMGDAFLAAPDTVMASVQRLRRQAQQAGNLKDNEYQKILEQPNPAAQQPQTIVIESANPQTVYVPSYNPAYVYGSWGYAGYPPYYYPPPAYYYPGAALAAGITFGIGIAITDSLWGDCDWGGGDININNERYNNINTNRERNTERNTERGDRGNRGESKWQHDSARRDGTPYRDNASREKYGKQLDGARDRTAMRGDDPGRTQARDNARQSMDRSGIGQPARSNMDAQNRARQMGDVGAGSGRAPGYQQRGQNNAGARDSARASSNYGSGSRDAFNGASNPRGSGAAAQRGRSSSGSMSRGGGASRGASRPVSRPPMRGGGGGGRRR